MWFLAVSNPSFHISIIWRVLQCKWFVTQTSNKGIQSISRKSVIPGLAVTLKLKMSAAQKLISGGWGGGRVCWLEEQGWQCGSGGSWWSAASAAAGPVPDAAAGASSSRLLEPAGQAAARWTWHLEENEQEHFPLLTCGEGVSQWMVMSFYQPDAFERWQGPSHIKV